MENNLTLGITKIGDLLYDNKITNIIKQDSSTKDSEQKNVYLVIPDYQRPYKWKAENANQLLDDIEEAMHSNKEIYRIGTLILHHDNNKYNIVDGQQRIITLSLLLKCLDKKLTNQNEEPEKEEGKVQEKDQEKEKNNNTNDTIKFLDQKLSDNPYTLHNVLNNYRAFERRIANIKNEEDINELKEYITKKCELIVVITDDISEAFQFFDSQNARGKALYPHDLLKAYHLREMNNIGVAETERIVKIWEDLDQKKLAELFNEYLYRLKEWIKGIKSVKLSEENLEMFKGVTSNDNFPYAQYHKGAFAYADELNNSYTPFVTGINKLRPFQINAPIIAGKPFFEYAKYYFDILTDIQNNDKYAGCLINDNEIIKTLDLYYKYGVGNIITRLMFDTAILLYVDRFCPLKPSKEDKFYLEQFIIFAFVWAYSMRAQYINVGLKIAQNYILNNIENIINSINIYKIICESDSPRNLLNKLTDKIIPLKKIILKRNEKKIMVETIALTEEELNNIDKIEGKTYKDYLHFFKEHKFLVLKES